MTKFLESSLLSTLALVFFLIPLSQSSYFSEPYTMTKWALVESFLVLSFLFFCFTQFSKNFFFPKIPRLYSYLLLFLFFYFFTTSFFYFSGNIETLFVHRFGFLIFVFSFYFVLNKFRYALETLSLCLIVSSFFVNTYGLAQVLGYFSTQGFASTFGNTNMTAQFLGLSLVCQLYFLSVKKNILLERILEAQIIFTLTYIYFLVCRSVYIGSVLCLVYGIFAFKNFRFLKWIRILFLAFLLSKTIQIVPKSTQDSTQNSGTHMYKEEPLQFVMNKKTSSTEIRRYLLEASFQLFKNHPMGVGVGNFEFEIVPYLANGKMLVNGHYSENSLFKSPHNEFLRFLCEDGIISFLLMMFLFLALCWKVFKEKNADSNKKALFFSGILFLGIEMLFQFPMENAVPFYTASFLIGLGLYLCVKPVEISINSYAPFVLGLIFCLLFACVYRRIESQYFTARFFNRYDKICKACDLQPSNWIACVEKGWKELRLRNIKGAKESAEKVLQRQPLNYPALKLISVVELTEKNWVRACEHMEVYEFLFQRKSSLHKEFMNYCVKN